MGLYVVFLLDWLTVFPRDQLLVLRLEDHALNRKFTMSRVFDFLSLGEDFKTSHTLKVSQSQSGGRSSNLGEAAAGGTNHVAVRQEG